MDLSLKEYAFDDRFKLYRTDQFRYTEWRDWKTGETVARELYDHSADPDETRNLANDAGQKAVVERHASLLQGMNPIVMPGWKPVLESNPQSKTQTK